MIFDRKLAKQVTDIVAFEDEIKKTDKNFHPKSAEQLEWQLTARGSKAFLEKSEGKIVGMLLFSNKRVYQAPVETYDFLKFLIGSQLDVEGESALPSHPDIFWLECVAVEEDHRGEGIAKELVRQACEYAREQANGEKCIVACGISTTNVAAQNLAARCGFTQIERNWTQDDFSDDGSYDPDFAWNILYMIA